VDVTRHDPSWIATSGDMISTTQDLHMFISALVGGKLLPQNLLDEMVTPHPKARATAWACSCSRPRAAAP
jgi:D-alanyl-D-alanine carboxypeptidase